MRNATHVPVNELPAPLQSALKAHGYGRKDISVEVSETASMLVAGDDGCRGFATLVNLDTGERKTSMGSWGGANPYNPTNRVDLDSTSRPLPEGFALIKGTEGGGRPVYAWITVNPANVAKLLPAGTEEELTDEERKAMTLFGYKGGSYRAEEARRMGLEYSATAPVFQSLIAKGLVAANKAGAMSVTTKGKNVRNKVRDY